MGISMGMGMGRVWVWVWVKFISIGITQLILSISLSFFFLSFFCVLSMAGNERTFVSLHIDGQTKSTSFIPLYIFFFY